MAYIGKNPRFNTGTLTPQSARPSNPVEGMIYYDDGTTNTEGVWKYQDGAWEFITSLIDYLKLIPQSADPTSPIEGQIQFADGTIRAKGLWQFKDGVWQPVGPAITGSLDIFYQQNFENDIDSSDFSNGNNSNFLGGGALVGTLSDETSSVISGEKSIKYTQAVGSLNDYIASELIPLEDKQQERIVKLSVEYKYSGNDDDIALIAYNSTSGAVIGEALIKSSSIVKKAEFRFFTSTAANIQYGFQTKVENDGAELIFDDVEITINQVIENVVEENFFNATVTNNGTSAIEDFNIEFIDSVTTIATGRVQVNFVPGFFTVAPSAVAIMRAPVSGGLSTWVESISTTQCVVSCGNDGVAFVNRDFSLHVARKGLDYKSPTSEIVLANEVPENVFSANIDGAGNILGQTGEFLDSVTVVSTGRYRLNFKAGKFTESPAVVPQTNRAFGTAQFVGASSITSSTADVFVSPTNNASGGVAFAFSVVVVAQGLDYKAITANIIQSSQRVAVLRKSTATGVSGASIGSGSTVRDLTEVVGDTEFLEFNAANSTVKLASGDYEIDLDSSFFDAGSGLQAVQLWLNDSSQSITDVYQDVLGSTQYMNFASNDDNMLVASLKGKFSVTTPTTFRIIQYSDNTGLTEGLASSSPQRQVYTLGTIKKLR